MVQSQSLWLYMIYCLTSDLTKSHRVHLCLPAVLLGKSAVLTKEVEKGFQPPCVDAGSLLYSQGPYTKGRLVYRGLVLWSVVGLVVPVYPFVLCDQWHWNSTHPHLIDSSQRL